MDHQLSENKLILLYIIREKENIKATDLSDFVIFRGYMDYFSMQSYIGELCDAGLVVEVMMDDTLYYTLHPQGEEVVELFRARIPHSTREDIRNYAKNSCLNGSPLLEVDAKIEKLGEEHYEVHCQVRDYDRPVLDFIKKAAEEQAAFRIRNEWLKKGMSVYWNLLKELN